MPFTRPVPPENQRLLQRIYRQSRHHAVRQRSHCILLYLDESGFCLIPYVPYGWQPMGETLELPSRRSQRLNVLGLMSRYNRLASDVSTQSITSEVVIACIDTFFTQVDKRTVIVMDQSSIHTSDAILDQLEA
ncbi:MAG: transposase [Leptolyngbyaceae cyanobacterium bins.349]|nr:transposase [Leptolyngbyaceae cyanobacterium bins.349]